MTAEGLLLAYEKPETDWIKGFSFLIQGHRHISIALSAVDELKRQTMVAFAIKSIKGLNKADLRLVVEYPLHI